MDVKRLDKERNFLPLLVSLSSKTKLLKMVLKNLDLQVNADRVGDRKSWPALGHYKQDYSFCHPYIIIYVFLKKIGTLWDNYPVEPTHLAPPPLL